MSEERYRLTEAARGLFSRDENERCEAILRLAAEKEKWHTRATLFFCLWAVTLVGFGCYVVTR